MCFFKTVSFKTILHIMKKLFLKYLFEFFVLVFGITLSFYLQEYGEDLNSIQKQKEGLTRILEDLTSDEAIFKLTLMSNESQIKTTKQLLGGVITATIYNKTVPYFGTFFNDTSIKSLIATGVVENYHNQQMITDILKYYRNDYDFITDQSSADEVLCFKRIDYVAKTIQIDSVSDLVQTDFGGIKMPYFYIAQKELDKLKKDSYFRGQLQNMIYVKSSYNTFVKEAIETNQTLQQMIKEEILLMN